MKIIFEGVVYNRIILYTDGYITPDGKLFGITRYHHNVESGGFDPHEIGDNQFIISGKVNYDMFGNIKYNVILLFDDEFRNAITLCKLDGRFIRYESLF